MCKKYESRFNVSSKAGFTETGQKGIGEGDMSLLSKPSYYNARHGSKEDIQTCALETSCLEIKKIGGNKDKLSSLSPSRNEEIMKPAALTLV